MAAEGKAIIFYHCDLFIFYFVSIDETPAMGSRPNLASRSEVVSVYKCLRKILGAPPPNVGHKKHPIYDHFLATPVLVKNLLSSSSSAYL